LSLTLTDTGLSSISPTQVTLNVAPVDTTIINGQALEISGASSQTIAFVGGVGMLRLDNPQSFTGKIVGLKVGDIIDLPNIEVASATINGSTLNIVGTDKQTHTSQTFSFQIAGDLSGNKFSILTSDAQLILAPQQNLPNSQIHILSSPPTISAGTV